MSVLQLKTAEAFEPLLNPSRYKGAHGGRGSGKSHFFADLLIDDSLREKGLRSVCIREVQKSLKDSAKRLIEDKLAEHRLGEADGFKVFREVIETPGDGVVIFQGMQDHTAESIKSLEGFKRAWSEEAQTLSVRSLSLLRPTIRATGSELWFSWNPRRKNDPVDAMLRGPTLPTGATVIRANWSDNPWFPAVLDQERRDCLRDNPDQYDHIWEGGYAGVIDGAYYAKSLAAAKDRIGHVSADPLMTYRAIFDIGGTGAKADAVAIWIAQFIGREIRVLNYYEAIGQPLATHVTWLRDNGYGKALIILPHDGTTNDKVFDVSYESALQQAGFETLVIPNQGKGAAAMRIEAARRLFPSIWFNKDTTQGGLDALGWYHERKDEVRGIGLGPEHDWSSHGCFHGETEVLTRYGTYQIMNLPKSGEVLTPCGWKQYILPRITQRDAPLVEVAFTSGHSVKCTPDHLFLTESGWKSAESLIANTAIQSTLTKSRSISMAVSIGYGRMIDTCRAAANVFTEMLGKLLLVRSPKAATSIIGTATHLITYSPISNASMPVSIFPSLGKTGARSARPRATSLRALGMLRLIGIDLLKVVFGTSATPSELKTGQNGSVKSGLVNIAKSHFRRSSAKAAMLESIAPTSAKLRPIEGVASLTNGRVNIASVRPLSEKADVWDITVPDGHCFSLANGAVVHNSDAFGLMCVAYEAPQEHEDRSPRFARMGGGWQGA